MKYCRLTGKKNENAEQRIGSLRLKANDRGYNERDIRLMEQFINNISDEEMITESKSLLLSRKLKNHK